MTSNEFMFKHIKIKLKDNLSIKKFINVTTVDGLNSIIKRSNISVLLIDYDSVPNLRNQILNHISNKQNVYIMVLSKNSTRNNDFIHKLNIDIIQLPRVINENSMKQIIIILEYKIKLNLNKNKIGTTNRFELNSMLYSSSSDSNLENTITARDKFVVIASSTGGIEALTTIITELPKDTHPILIVQHMSNGFTKFFAERINKLANVEVREAKDHDYLRKGLVLIAPAGKHMTLSSKNKRLIVECYVGEKVLGIMPSADILFLSISSVMNQNKPFSNILAIILTGMGKDGVRGLLELKIKGAHTIGQNESTSMVYGMPKAAFDVGAVVKQLGINEIGKEIIIF